MKSVVWTCLVLIATTTACATAREKKQKKEDTASMPAAELIENLEEYRKSDPFTILAVRVAENTMELDVEFSGGCENHEFKLYGSTMLMKSLPPKRGILLWHNANGDSCRSIEQRTLKFNITALAYAGGEVILNLDGWKEPISYTQSK